MAFRAHWQPVRDGSFRLAQIYRLGPERRHWIRTFHWSVIPFRRHSDQEEKMCWVSAKDWGLDTAHLEQLHQVLAVRVNEVSWLFSTLVFCIYTGTQWEKVPERRERLHLSMHPNNNPCPHTRLKWMEKFQPLQLWSPDSFTAYNTYLLPWTFDTSHVYKLLENENVKLKSVDSHLLLVLSVLV